MKKRHNQILVGILVVQIILSVVVFWPRSSAAVAGEPLFPDLESGDVVALTITDANGDEIRLSKVDGDGSTELAEGGSTELAEVWVLPDADDYPAQVDKITPLLDGITGLTTGRLVTRTDASQERLQVASDDFQRRIEFETQDGAMYILYLGSSPSYGATHFRVGGQSETYLTDAISTWETGATAASWIDAAYLSVTLADVNKVTLENNNGTFVFVRGGEDNWIMEGLAEDETLAETNVTATIGQAASLNMIDPLGKAEQASYGMDEPNAVATLETDASTITLRVGAKDPGDNSYVVISSESPYYVRVSEFGVRNLVDNARDNFLDLPPTPTPEGSTDTQ
jgi:hypothetical protein